MPKIMETYPKVLKTPFYILLLGYGPRKSPYKNYTGSNFVKSSQGGGVLRT